MSEYQDWLLIDMHTHSEFSKYGKPSDSGKVKNMSAKEFVDTLYSYGVKIFSITDHNYFSEKYYNEIEHYINEEKLEIKIINGVELDVYVESKKLNDYVHICIYFDDTVDRQKLQNIIYGLYHDDNGEDLKPDFLKILNELYELKSKFMIVPHGDKDRGVLKNKLMDRLTMSNRNDYYKYAMYKIFNAFDVTPNFYGKSEQFWATTFYEQTKKFNEISDSKTKEQLIEMEKNISEKIKGNDIELSDEEQLLYNYVLKYGAYFSYFNFSDWHNGEEYAPKTNNFIFGSLNLAFESFEMATLDPISRIDNSKEKSIDIPNTILSNINFDINGKTKEIYLSPGLNAIVGKRGSGKSLLLSAIKNLVDKDAEDGALKTYKTLNISNISGKNRGGINISLGGLNSVAFLTQDEIKEIFENPNKAQQTISNYFIDINDIDMSKINKILELGEKIVPIDENYKNVTSNILSIKKFDDYNYKKIDELLINKFNLNFDKATTNLKEAIKNINELGLNSDEINIALQKLDEIKNNYNKYIELYNAVIKNLNLKIDDINSKHSSNQVTQRQNINDIKVAINQIKENFNKQLIFEKFKYLLEEFSMTNPPVEIFKKGKYLFVTYYEIPEDIKDIIIDKITDSLVRSNKIQDIKAYLLNNDKKLKASSSNIVTELKKYINNNDMFKAKKEFYEIRNIEINYETEINKLEDLKENVDNNNLINLTNASPGMRSVAYLDMLFDLDETILILDQPEDNIDNDYISNYLVPNIKLKKKIKQLIFVTHNPSVAVYGDAFNYVFVENNEEINYTNYLIEKKEDKEDLIRILEGGRNSFSNRNKKFGNVLGEEEYGIN